MKNETKFKNAALSYDTLLNCKFIREGKSKYHIIHEQLHIIVTLDNNVYTLKCLHQDCVLINKTISDFKEDLENTFAAIDYHLTVLNEVKSMLNATKHLQVVETQVQGLETFTFNCGVATVTVKPLSQGYDLTFDDHNQVLTKRVETDLTELILIHDAINNYDEHIHLLLSVEYALKNSENLQPLEQPKVTGLKEFNILTSKDLITISKYDLYDSEETTFKHGYKIRINDIVAKTLTINDILTTLAIYDKSLTTTNSIKDTYKSEPENIYSYELKLIDEFVKDFHTLLKTNSTIQETNRTIQETNRTMQETNKTSIIDTLSTLDLIEILREYRIDIECNDRKWLIDRINSAMSI